MKTHIFTTQQATYPVALLIKDSAFVGSLLESNYLQYMKASKDIFIGMSLTYNESNKTNITIMNNCIKEMIPYIDYYQIKTLFVADANYFKFLTKEKKADVNVGYVLPCKYKGLEHLNIILGINYQAIQHNPNNQEKVLQSVATLDKHINGQEAAFSSSVLSYEYYPETLEDIKDALVLLRDTDKLCVDIEAYSLKFWEAGIATISFSWNDHAGIAFAVDAVACDPYEYVFWCKKDKKHKTAIGHHRYEPNMAVRELLREFFLSYTGNLIAHNCNYDFKVLIHNLFTKGLGDNENVIRGIECFTRQFDDTRIIAYLATNSCARTPVNLKSLCQPYLGNYAEDVTDIRKVKLPELLKYNLLDTVGTAWVYDKYYPIMVADKQEELYLGLFKESLKNIIHTEMSGIPIDMEEVTKLDIHLKATYESLINRLDSSPIIQDAKEKLRFVQWKKDYRDRLKKAKKPEKIKYKPWDDFQGKWKYSSNNHIAFLLYDYCDLPVLDTTDTGLPATGAKEIDKLQHHTNDKELKEVINSLVDLTKLTKIQSSFIPAFKAAPKALDGKHYLFGNFVLGGTVSGRLSSNNINMQNLPSSRSPFAKPVKKCFKSNEDWWYVGYDFASLEDRISALTTKDPNKIKVYTDGYCGHCLRAFSYFGDKMPDIVDTVESINSIQYKYPVERQDSKAPTFALTYQGMWKTLVKNCGFTEQVAKQIEARYHELYVVSDMWVQDKLKQACSDGYVTGAFGLKVRTPLLQRSIYGNGMTYDSEKEGRTAGNALGQSWCLLNNRCMNAIMQRVLNSEFKYDIVPCGQIHDAGYFRVKAGNVDALLFLNMCITEESAWQDHPDIHHPEVGLSAELDVFKTWAEPVTLKNTASYIDVVNALE